MVLEGAPTVPTGTSVDHNVESMVTGKRPVGRSQNRREPQKPDRIAKTGPASQKRVLLMSKNESNDSLKVGWSKEKNSSDDEAMHVWNHNRVRVINFQ